MNLILFFTYGVSLRTWDETGLIDREILIYKKLLEKGIKVSFITYDDESDYQYQDKLGDIEIIPFYAFVKKPSNKVIKFLQSFFLPFILKKQLQKADIFKTNQMSMTWAPLLAKLIFKKKLIIRCGFEWYRFLVKKSQSIFLKLFVYITELFSYYIADGIILTSENDRQYIIKKFYIKNWEKIKVISNFIDTDTFKPLDSFRKKNNHLIFIGRLTEQKNLLNLFEALKDSKYCLDIIGDGELKEKLINYSVQNQVRINFLSKIPNSEMPHILNQYHTFIFPSYYEGNPKALLEAMSCRLAVIGTNVEGINNVIKHKENGYLCKTDSQSIRDAIDVVMEDELLRKRMGVQARKFVINHCSINEIVKKEIDFYTTVLKC
ncbi:MAG: glycosyltransferase family 4 protein [Nitrospirota bacterium]